MAAGTTATYGEARQYLLRQVPRAGLPGLVNAPESRASGGATRAACHCATRKFFFIDEGCKRSGHGQHDLPDAQSLQEIAEKLRLTVADSRLDLGSGSLVVTIALGATLIRPDDTPESLVRRADQLMYRSNQAGSHRVAMG